MQLNKADQALEISKIQKGKQANFKKILRFMVEIKKVVKGQRVLELSTKSLSLTDQLFFAKFAKNIKYIIDHRWLSSYTPANNGKHKISN